MIFDGGLIQCGFMGILMGSNGIEARGLMGA
jgi:hypothetical protein